MSTILMRKSIVYHIDSKYGPRIWALICDSSLFGWGLKCGPHCEIAYIYIYKMSIYVYTIYIGYTDDRGSY